MLNHDILYSPIFFREIKSKRPEYERGIKGYQRLLLNSDGSISGLSNFCQNKDMFSNREKVKVARTMEEFFEYVEWYRRVWKKISFSITNSILFDAKQQAKEIAPYLLNDNDDNAELKILRKAENRRPK